VVGQGGKEQTGAAGDVGVGRNFVLDMHEAAKWAAAFAADPTSEKGKLVLVRVKECGPEGMLKAIVYIDLVGLGIPGWEDAKVDEVYAAVKGELERRGAYGGDVARSELGECGQRGGGEGLGEGGDGSL